MQELINSINLLINLDEKVMSIIYLSIYVSFSATIFATILALPLGIWLTVENIPLKNTIISIVNALTGLPPVVLGLIVYILLSRTGPLGELGILYTPKAMIITQTILVVPIIASQIRIITEPYYNNNKPYYKVLKLSKYHIITSIIFDIRFNVFTAIMSGLGRALSEVGAILIVGGNINNATRTMTTAISLETGKGNLQTALALGIVLLTIIIIINIIVTYINSYTKKYYGY